VSDEAFDLMSALVLEDGRRWGDAAAPCQIEDARATLDWESPTPYHLNTRARGYSKSSDNGGISVAVMLAQLPPGSKLYAVAADLDQGRLIVEAINGFAIRTPELRGALEISNYKIVAVRTGSTLEILPADGASAWGLRPSFIVIDELAAWPSTRGAHQIWEAVTSAAAKVPGCRMVVLTTAGDPAHWSKKILDHAISDPLWRVHQVKGPPPWADPQRLAEQRRRLPPSMYARLFENEWTSGEDRLVGAEDLAACVTLDGPLEPISGMSYVIGLDVGLKRDSTVATICHVEHGIVYLDRIATWTGTRLRPVKLGEVESWIEKAAKQYRARVVVDPWQAAQLTERLRARGVRITEYTFSAQSVGRLASTLYLLLRERGLRLPDDPELLDELANVRLRDTSPGVMRMDHDSNRHDDRALSLALAAHALVSKTEVTEIPMRTSVARKRIDVGSTGPTGGLSAHSESLLEGRYGRAIKRFRRSGKNARTPLDRRLNDLGIASWDADRGRGELDDINRKAAGS
jgi:Phage Terminase